MSAHHFYKNVTALDKEKHKSLKLKPMNDLTFVGGMNSMPVAGFEFFEASRDFPVFFSKTNTGFIPVVLLSFKNDDKGIDWAGRYVPAFVRRYPFIISSDGAVLFDEESHLISESEGKELFTEEADPSEHMKEVLTFLETCDRGYKITEEFCKTLDEKGLLEPFNRSVNFDGEKVDLSPFFIVNEKKLQELDEADVYTLFKNGWLAWCYAQLHSVGSVSEVVKRMREEQ